MKIDQIELRKIFLPYLSPFQSSGWTEKGNQGIIIKVSSDSFFGYGEIPLSLHPYYVEETTSTAWSVIIETLSPILFKSEINSPAEIDKLFQPIRGNNFAKAGLEFAVWDLSGKINNKSLSGLLGGVYKKINVGVSIGIQPSIEKLLSDIDEYVKQGYKRIKIKIKPGWDIEPLEEIRQHFPSILLQADANGAYTLEDSSHLSKLDVFNLLLIEQPLAHNDIYEHSLLQKKLKTPICLDESITSVEHAKWAIGIDACRIINIKPSRVGGLTAAKKIHDLAAKAGIPVWCGGMLETGIGRAINVSLASLPNFLLPGDISANDRYYKRDIVLNPFVLNEDSTITVPDMPGSGFIVDEKYLSEITIEKLILTNNH